MLVTLIRKSRRTRRASENPFALSKAKGSVVVCGLQTLRFAQGERD